MHRCVVPGVHATAVLPQERGVMQVRAGRDRELGWRGGARGVYRMVAPVVPRACPPEAGLAARWHEKAQTRAEQL